MLSATQWNALTLEQKVDALHKDVTTLTGIMEELSHKHHIFSDALHIMQGTVDGVHKHMRILERKAVAPEFMF